MLYTAYMHEGPSSVRYPRGAGVGVEQEEQMTQLEIGKASVERKGQGTAILSFGSMLVHAMQAAEQLDATVVNMRFVKPIDEEMVLRICESHDLVMTIEEHVVLGGAGSAVNEVVAKYGILTRLANMGLPDEHVDHGVPKLVFAEHGLDADAIIQRVQSIRSLDMKEYAT